MSGQAESSSLHLLGLPAELRLKIFDFLVLRPSKEQQVMRRIAANDCGFTDGVGRITLTSQGGQWRSISIAKPQGFGLLNIAILSVCRLLHKEAMDLFYSKMLFVVSMQYPHAWGGTGSGCKSAIVAGPSQSSILFNWINYVHILQHVRLEDDLLQKAQALRSLLACLNRTRTYTKVTLHFDSMWLFHNGERARKERAEHVWSLYAAEMAKLNLGAEPELRVSPPWIELEGIERFESLATTIGGNVNSPAAIHW